jgi:hypothetical protein
MEENQYQSANIEAEKTILNAKLQVENFLTTQEKVNSSYLEIELPEATISNPPSFISQFAATENQNKNNLNVAQIQEEMQQSYFKETQNLKNQIDQSIIPSLQDLYASLSDRTKKDDSKKFAESRPTFIPQNLFFTAKNFSIASAPSWS